MAASEYRFQAKGNTVLEWVKDLSSRHRLASALYAAGILVLDLAGDPAGEPAPTKLWR